MLHNRSKKSELAASLETNLDYFEANFGPPRNFLPFLLSPLLKKELMLSVG